MRLGAANISSLARGALGDKAPWREAQTFLARGGVGGAQALIGVSFYSLTALLASRSQEWDLESSGSRVRGKTVPPGCRLRGRWEVRTQPEAPDRGPQGAGSGKEGCEGFVRQVRSWCGSGGG